MKDYSRIELERGRPDRNPYEAVVFALDRLYEDKTRAVTDEVVRGLTFDDLIGVLLLARDIADIAEDLDG